MIFDPGGLLISFVVILLWIGLFGLRCCYSSYFVTTDCISQCSSSFEVLPVLLSFGSSFSLLLFS